MSELEMLIKWLQERPNNAAVFATDDGFMVQTLEAGDTVREVEALTIGGAIRQYQDKYEKAGE